MSDKTPMKSRRRILGPQPSDAEVASHIIRVLTPNKVPAYANDGSQLHDGYRADLLPSLALLELSKLLKKGAEDHGDTDPSNPKWLATPVNGHINRAMVHLLSFLAGDTQEEHLLHASCRLLFALHSDLRQKLRAK